MSKLKWYFLFAAAVLLAGCTYDPVDPAIDFGSVYVGETATGSGSYRNNANKPADVAGYSVNRPFVVSGSAEIVQPGKDGAVLTVVFAPADAGPAEDEIRPGLANAMDVRATPLKLKGRGVWSKSEGGFSFENMPAVIVGSLTLGSAPIVPNRPIDWGVRKLGGPATEAEFFVRNSNVAPVNGTAEVRLLHGDRNFKVTFPGAQTGMSISGAGGTQTREIHVSFTPAAVGDWMDIVEVVDTANPAARAGIVLKAKVTETGD